MKQGGVSVEIVFNYYLPSVALVIYGCRRDFVAATTHESPVPDLHTHNPPPPTTTTPSTHPAISYPRWLRGSFLLLRCFACFLCAGYYGFESTAFIYDIGCFCIYFRAPRRLASLRGVIGMFYGRLSSLLAGSSAEP